MKKQLICGTMFANIPTQLKSALKLKLLLSQSAINNTDEADLRSWLLFRGFDGIYVLAPSGKCYRIKLKPFLVEALLTALNDNSELANWRVFRGHDGIYTIHSSGKYYKISINSQGKLKIYRGKNRIHLGRQLEPGYFEASMSLST